MTLESTSRALVKSTFEIVGGAEQVVTKAGKATSSDPITETSSSYSSFVRCLNSAVAKAETECRKDTDTFVFAPIFSLHTLFTSKVKGVDTKAEVPEKMEQLVTKLLTNRAPEQSKVVEILQVVQTLIRHSPLKSNNFHWPSSYHFEHLSPNKGTLTFKIDLLDYHQKKSIQLLLNTHVVFPETVSDDKITFQVDIPSSNPRHFSGTLNVPLDTDGDSQAEDSKVLSYKFVCPIPSKPDKDDHKKDKNDKKLDH